MLESQIIPLEDFSVSLQNGFLPSDLPIQTLIDPYYEPWEALIKNLPFLIRNGDIRERVIELPILTTENLVGESQCRRAYSVLSFLAHSYIWGGAQPEDTLPPAISRPYLEISSKLELPPCATYAALNLWNYKLVEGRSDDLADPDNLDTLCSMTGTDDERWFFVISVAIEAHGANVIPMVLNTIDAINRSDYERVTKLLAEITGCIVGLTKILDRMHERCDPEVFYHQIRPMLAGSKNMADAGLPRGVFYDEGKDVGRWLQLNGGSNAQSSLVQLFDIFLGIAHSAYESGKSGSMEPKLSQQHPFMQEMRNYMPGPHRRFLHQIEQIANVRSFATNLPADSDVRQAYNTAVMVLGSFRDKHMQIVARYIIMPSRKLKMKEGQAVSNLIRLPTSSLNIRPTNLATANSRKGAGKIEILRGTGGTELIPFLKNTRDETKAAAFFAS